MSEQVLGRECRGFVDRMAQGINELYCTCGARLWPDCDMSAASIVECYENHLRERGIDPEQVNA